MDWIFRDLITSFGGVSQVTTEFVRVTKNLHPNKVFYRYAPELLSGSKTRCGTPLFIQLLGGEPEPLALNAARAVELGALGIDLNFGCPAKTVNRHDGGASLLKSPRRLLKIAQAVRQAVPANIPVTAKMRLGFEDTSLCLENAFALQEGGMQKLTVHARTKKQGYKPPAHWEWIAQIKEVIQIPIVANGDIVDFESLKKCQEITGCSEFMIGRQALKNPHVFRELQSPTPIELKNWQDQKQLIGGFYLASRQAVNPYFAAARTKQFLRNLSLVCENSKSVFDQTKILTKPQTFEPRLFQLLDIDPSLGQA